MITEVADIAKVVEIRPHVPNTPTPRNSADDLYDDIMIMVERFLVFWDFSEGEITAISRALDEAVDLGQFQTAILPIMYAWQKRNALPHLRALS